MNEDSKSIKKPFVKIAILAVASIALLITIFTILTPPAEKGYRYWGYYQANTNSTEWTAAMTGPTVDIEDGSVEGWIFTFSSTDIPSTAPSVIPNFETICGGTEAVEGKKRIGLVVDFGDSAISPEGETAPTQVTRCVVTEMKSQGIDVLSQALDVRSDASGLICGINGFPSRECGVEIVAPKALTKKQ
jgi:hypothetical protein